MATTRTITDGSANRTLTTTLTDVEARDALMRVTHAADRQFARELAGIHDRRRLSQKQAYWFHKLALDQVARERRSTIVPTTRVAPITSRPAPQPSTHPETFSLVGNESDQNPTPTPPQQDEEIDEAKVDSLKACLLIYDIPVPRNGESEIPNPSGRLRRIAVRVNLSCWVIQEGDIPYKMLDDMAARGASWHVVRFDSNEGRRLVRMAISAMRKEIEDAVERSRRCHETAEQILEDDGDANATRLRQRYLQRAEQICTRFETMTRDLEAAAHRFGINPNTLRISQAHTVIQAIQTAMHTRARLYSEAIARLRAVNTTDANAMANAMANDQVPAEIAADMLEDNGQDGSALRESFSNDDE